jgi:ABC-type glycerol-3-phosphate transport system substrate-binding protein
LARPVSPFLAWGGWSYFVLSGSKAPDETFEFLAYIANPENSMYDCLHPRANPWRYSHGAQALDHIG